MARRVEGAPRFYTSQKQRPAMRSSSLSSLLPLAATRVPGLRLVSLPVSPFHDIVRIADDHHLALRPLLTPDVHPEIEAVVQVHVGEER